MRLSISLPPWHRPDLFYSAKLHLCFGSTENSPQRHSFWSTVSSIKEALLSTSVTIIRLNWPCVSWLHRSVSMNSSVDCQRCFFEYFCACMNSHFGHYQINSLFMHQLYSWVIAFHLWKKMSGDSTLGKWLVNGFEIKFRVFITVGASEKKIFMPLFCILFLHIPAFGHCSYHVGCQNNLDKIMVSCLLFLLFLSLSFIDFCWAETVKSLPVRLR